MTFGDIVSPLNRVDSGLDLSEIASFEGGGWLFENRQAALDWMLQLCPEALRNNLAMARIVDQMFLAIQDTDALGESFCNDQLEYRAQLEGGYVAKLFPHRMGAEKPTNMQEFWPYLWGDRWELLRVCLRENQSLDKQYKWGGRNRFTTDTYFRHSAVPTLNLRVRSYYDDTGKLYSVRVLACFDDFVPPYMARGIVGSSPDAVVFDPERFVGCSYNHPEQKEEYLFGVQQELIRRALAVGMYVTGSVSKASLMETLFRWAFNSAEQLVSRAGYRYVGPISSNQPPAAVPSQKSGDFSDHF